MRRGLFGLASSVFRTPVMSKSSAYLLSIPNNLHRNLYKLICISKRYLGVGIAGLSLARASLSARKVHAMPLLPLSQGRAVSGRFGSAFLLVDSCSSLVFSPNSQCSAGSVLSDSILREELSASLQGVHGWMLAIA